MNETPKAGDIVKITTFSGWLYDGEHIWARVVSVCEAEQDFDWVADIKMLTATKRPASHIAGQWDELWPLGGCDGWEIVPESKVPARVWAQAAERQLMGVE